MKKVFILLQGSFISMLLAACGNMKVTEEEVVKATEAGLYLKKYWKGKLDRLSVTHLRDDGWLKDNLKNPLRHWDGKEFIPGGAYRSARKCYKDTELRKYGM